VPILDLISWINEVLRPFLPIITTVGIAGGLGRVIWMMSKSKATEKADAERRLCSLEGRVNALDNEDTGRVTKMSNLQIDQINECKKAWGLATYVKGRFDGGQG